MNKQKGDQGILCGEPMEELIKELSNMSGFIRDLWLFEKDRKTKLSFLKMYLTTSRFLTTGIRYKNLTSKSSYYIPSIQKIRETGALVKEYKEKARHFDAILDHIMKITNWVSRVFLDLIREKNQINPDELSMDTWIEPFDEVLTATGGQKPPFDHEFANQDK